MSFQFDHHGHPPQIDFASAAKQLGVKEAQLKEALGVPERPPARSAIGSPDIAPPRPDVKGAALKLNLSEEALSKALGIPPIGDHPPEHPNHPY